MCVKFKVHSGMVFFFAAATGIAMVANRNNAII